MLDFLRNHPYLLAVLFAFFTAGLVWMYKRTLEPDADKALKTFNVTLAAALIAGLSLTWLANRQERISTEPFAAA